MRNANVRFTDQRIALLSVISEANDHPDVLELQKRAKKICPSISLATVYRTLLSFLESGVVHRNSFEGGGARYEMAKEEHHDHIIDVDTGEVVEFNSDIIENLQFEIASKMGYDVIHHRLDLYCRKVSK
ncbi:MAG: Fur family transcriptional regulator [Proteobacteria bacterium]|nr:Fur family transcriptional regulator [Pseudomonadota bacterium]